MATVSLELAGDCGAASAAVKRMAQKASDRRKDALIGKKAVSDIRRIWRAAQDNETKLALLGRDRQPTALNIQKLPYDGICDL
jgi:hypothetical protein